MYVLNHDTLREAKPDLIIAQGICGGFYLPVKIKVKNREVYRVKVSQLCKMIEDSIHNGKYPLQNEHKPYANLLQVINRSDSDDLKSNEIKIEVRMRGLYIISNYVPNIQHLPGIIEGDVDQYIFDYIRTISKM